MSSIRALIFVLALGCCAVQAADDPAQKKLIKEKVEEINNALMKDDFGKIADLTCPKVFELVGGREKMIAAMESTTKEMKAQGFSVEAAKVDEPSDTVTSGSDLLVIVPFSLEMKAPGGKLFQKSFVIGLSSDKGKSWTFVNGDMDNKLVRKVLPPLPEQLKIPEKQKPVFEKN